MNKSPAERHIDQTMAELDPASERFRVLDCARRFKSSWVELGEQLTKVRRDGLFRQWGHDSFEEYCGQEIRIRKGTADKLTMAYHFMEKEEPALLARHGELHPLPDYRAVDLLRQAKEEKAFPAEDYTQLRQAVFDEERSFPTIQKRFKELGEEAHGPDPVRINQNALRAARSLLNALAEIDGVSSEQQQAITALVEFLEEKKALLENAGNQAESL